MIVSISTLEDLGACQEGKDDFARLIGDGPVRVDALLERIREHHAAGDLSDHWARQYLSYWQAARRDPEKVRALSRRVVEAPGFVVRAPRSEPQAAETIEAARAARVQIIRDHLRAARANRSVLMRSGRADRVTTRPVAFPYPKATADHLAVLDRSTGRWSVWKTYAEIAEINRAALRADRAKAERRVRIYRKMTAPGGCEAWEDVT